MAEFGIHCRPLEYLASRLPNGIGANTGSDTANAPTLVWQLSLPVHDLSAHTPRRVWVLS